ncbi:MAG: hypothetical protein R3D62_08090 [Xanthobacteraceae bacterium]
MPASEAAAEKSFNLLDFLRRVTTPQQQPRKVRRRSSVSAEWRKIPAKELDCIDRELRKQGTSAKTLRRQGVPVTDKRVADLRPQCQKEVEEAAKGDAPAASASTASPPTTADKPATAPSATAKPPTPGSTPSATGAPAAVVSAGGAATAVAAAGTSDKPASAAGSPGDAEKTAAAAREQLSAYEVEDLTLGSEVSTGDLRSAAFQCSASEQFAGLTWCQHARRERSGRLDHSTLVSILYTGDKRAAYVNRVSEPVEFDGRGRAALDAEVARLTRKFGQEPRLLRIPDRRGLPDSLIAIWGSLQLEPLDSDSIATLASGESPRKGLLIEYLGNFQRSAKLDLPVYRLASGAGYVWSGSADRRGRGHQRSLIFDADLAMPPQVAAVSPAASPSPTNDNASAVAPPDDGQSAAERAAADKAVAEKAEAARVAAEKAAAEKAEADRAAAEKAEAEKVAAARAAAEKAAADKLAAETLAAQRLAAERAAEQAALEKAAAEKEAAERAAQEKAASDEAAADAAQEAAERAAAEQAAAQKLAAAKAAAEKAAAEKAALEKSAAEKIAAARAALDKLAAEKAALEKAAAEKVAAARAAAEKAAAEKAAAEKAAAQKIKAAQESAAAKAAAERAAAEQAAAEKLAEEKAAAEKAAAEKFAKQKAAAEKAAAEKIAAEREAAEKAAAERVAAEKAAAEKAARERIAATRLALAKQATAGETVAERAAAAGPRSEERAAKFRNLYVGMPSDRFGAAIKKLKLDVKMQLSSYRSGDEKEHHLLLEMMRKGSTKPVMYADVRLETPVSDKFASTYKLKVLDKTSDYTIYSGLNPPKLPKFTVRRLVFYQGFFDAVGINAEEFARLLREKYRLVGSGLRDGTAKDQCEQCMVGLLRTGESLVLRFGADDQWSLEVEEASDEFSQLFRTPKL